MSENKRKGVIRDITKLEKGAEIPLADFQIAFSSDDGTPWLVNLDLIEQDNEMSNYKIKPGFWRVTPRDGLNHLQFEDKTYFETETYKELTKFFTSFISKPDVYEKLGIPKKRGILLGSVPGCGKSSLIDYFIRKNVKQLEGACVLRIDSDKVAWETILQMFINAKEKDAKFVLLVIEDIGGTGLDGQDNGNISPEMLNFLDGTSDLFKIRTLVVGTTNYIDQLGKPLSDRPGRFDIVREVSLPTNEECFQLVEDFLDKLYPGRKLTQEERTALQDESLTPAYCKEIVIRAELADMTLLEATKEVLAQKKKSGKRNHSDPRRGRSAGFGND